MDMPLWYAEWNLLVRYIDFGFGQCYDMALLVGRFANLFLIYDASFSYVKVSI